ncbi:MAG: DNA polymerase III subunit delta [Sedimentisphaeraceae bacterium JB056]
MAKNEKSEFCPVYVIAGKDSFLVNKECEAILSSLMDPEERDMAMYSVEANKAEITDVLDELRTLPFLAKKRVVVIRDADKFVSANREQLEKYLDNPSKKGILVMTVSSWPKTTRIAKKAAKVGKTIVTEEIKRWKLADYAVGYAKTEYNKKLSKTAAQLIVDMAGDEVALVCGEIAKLTTYVGEAKEITADDVTKLCGNNREFDLFAVIDEMSKGRTAVAVEKLRNMFSTSKDAEYTVVGGLAFHFRRMFRARAMMDSGISTFEIAKQLRIWGDKDSFFTQLRKWQLTTIASIIEALARIDFESKTGQCRTNVEIEQLIMKVSMKLSRR